MSTCGEESGIINIGRLPIVESVGCGDYFVVETALQGTAILDFCNLIIGEDNITFNDILTNVKSNSANWSSTHTTVQTKSADWEFKTAIFDNSHNWTSAYTTVNANSAQWRDMVLWGNHATAGYLKLDSVPVTIETDPIFTAHVANTLTSSKIDDWDTTTNYVNTLLVGSLVGKATNNKALIVDGSKDVSDLRNLSITGDLKVTGSICSTGAIDSASAITEYSSECGESATDPIRANTYGPKVMAGANLESVTNVDEVTINSKLNIREITSEGGAGKKKHHVVFDTPLPNADYLVTGTATHAGRYTGVVGHSADFALIGETKTVNGFSFAVSHDDPGGVAVATQSDDISFLVTQLDAKLVNLALGGVGTLNTTNVVAIPQNSTHTFPPGWSKILLDGGYVATAGANSESQATARVIKMDDGTITIASAIAENRTAITNLLPTAIPGGHELGGAGFGAGEIIVNADGSVRVTTTYKTSFIAEVQSPGPSTGTVTRWNSGWVDRDPAGIMVDNRATLTFTHNMGSVDVITELWVATDSTGTNAQRVNDSWVWSNDDLGANFTEPTLTSITVQLAENGYSIISSNGRWNAGTSYSGKFIKVVMLA